MHGRESGCAVAELLLTFKFNWLEARQQEAEHQVKTDLDNAHKLQVTSRITYTQKSENLI